jgi:hypothetical protein
VFARSGAIIPLILGDDVETLCDSNYINNSAIKTWDGGLEISIYPEGTTSFTMFDGTEVTSKQAAGSSAVTLTSADPRLVVFRIHVSRPASVRRDGAVVAEAPTPAAFAAASAAWRFEAVAGFVLVKFPHAGGTTSISL